jgi:hypothetical protein
MSLKININTFPIKNIVEKFVIKNLNKIAPQSYAPISEKEVERVYNKSISEFPTQKNLTKEVIVSIRNNYMRNYMIFNHKNLIKNSKKIIEDYDNGMDVVKISGSYDISPLNILREVFNKKYKNKLTKLILNPKLLSTHDINQLELAVENDVYALIDQSQIKKDSIDFEKDIENILIKNGVKFKTQDELVEEQMKTHGKAINTPDFLIESDLYINGSKVNWIDAKNFYGANIPFVKDKIKKQTRKYLDTWGPGCIIFKLGFNEKLRFNNILMINYQDIL